MFCERCGKENPNEAKFCRACGSPLQMKAPAPEKRTSGIPVSEREAKPVEKAKQAQNSLAGQVPGQERAWIPQDAPPKRKKSSGKAGKIILVICLILVLAAAAIFAVSKLAGGDGTGLSSFSKKKEVLIPITVKDKSRTGDSSSSMKWQFSIDGSTIYTTNIQSFDEDTYGQYRISEYDEEGRMTSSTVYLYVPDGCTRIKNSFDYDDKGNITRMLTENISFNGDSFSESANATEIRYDSNGVVEDITTIDYTVVEGEYEDSESNKADLEVKNNLLTSYSTGDDKSGTTYEYAYNEDGYVEKVVMTTYADGEAKYINTLEYDGTGKGIIGPTRGALLKQSMDMADPEGIDSTTSYTIEYVKMVKGEIVVGEDVSFKEISKDVLKELKNRVEDFEEGLDDLRKEAAEAAEAEAEKAAAEAAAEVAAEKEAAEKEAAEKEAAEKEAAEKAAAEKAAAEKAAAEKAAEEKASSDESFYYGTWVATTADYEGISIDIEQILDESMAFEFKAGGVVTVYIGDESENGKWELTADGINVEDEFIMKRDGNDLVIEEDGVLLRFVRK